MMALETNVQHHDPALNSRERVPSTKPTLHTKKMVSINLAQFYFSTNTYVSFPSVQAEICIL